MTTPPKRREAPTEPFKRALSVAVRAIAGDEEVQVGFGPGRAELEGKSIQLPEPSRAPSPREIAVIRGWADSLALTAACHDAKLHRKLAPPAGDARAVFEAAERARVEALGANRMSGMADNLAAKCEEQYAHGRFARVKDKAEAPLEDALALLVRERLTGRPPPDAAKALVDVWRPALEKRAGKVLKKMDGLAGDQESFGRLVRDLLKALDLADDLGQTEKDESEEESEQEPEGGDSEAESDEDGEEGKDQAGEEQSSEGDAGEAAEGQETADQQRLRPGHREHVGIRHGRAVAAERLRTR